MLFKKIIRLILIFPFIVLIIYGSCCKGKTPTSPDLDEVENPAIWINVTEMSFTATESGENPASQILQVKNSGLGTLSYSIACDMNCVSISPTSGTSTDNVNEHTVFADISGLNQGNYSGKITITCSNATNSPQAVNVSLEISSPPTDNEISISCDPSSGGSGTIATISMAIKGNIQEIEAFGLELTYDTTMFEYQSVSKGDRTVDWALVDGYEVSSGTIRIGGYAGNADSIPRGSVGSIVKVSLKVTCSGCNDDQESQICIQNYTDDIVGMISTTSCVTFTYKK